MIHYVHAHVQGKQRDKTKQLISQTLQHLDVLNRAVKFFNVLQDILTVVVCDKVGDSDAVMCIRHSTTVVCLRSPQGMPRSRSRALRAATGTERARNGHGQTNSELLQGTCSAVPRTVSFGSLQGTSCTAARRRCNMLKLSMVIIGLQLRNIQVLRYETIRNQAEISISLTSSMV